MSVRIKETVVETLNPKLVSRYREMKKINNDRVIDKTRIRNHLKAIKAGEFLNNLEWAEVFCREDEETYRANGQHTSHLISWMEQYRKDEKSVSDQVREMCGWKSTEDLPPRLENKVVRTVWECDTVAELSVIFSQYDNSITMRHSRDRLAVHAGNFSELLGVDGQILSMILAAIAAYSRSNLKGQSDAVLGVEGFVAPSAQTLHLMFNHKGVRDFIVWFLDLTDEVRILMRQVPTGKWVVHKYEMCGPNEAAKAFEKIIQEDDQQEGPGYELMGLVRKQLDRKAKKQSPDKLIRAMNRWFEELQAELV